MASPQLENGYTSIANEIVEQLARTHLNGYESRYLWALWRCTYGWHKTEDRISNSQFVEKTGLKKQHIWRTESNLIKRGIVTKNGYKISFNKDYSHWIELPKLPKKVTVTNSGIKVTNLGIKVTKNGAHKRNLTKEIILKKEEGNPDGLQGSQWNELIDSFKDINPSYLDFYSNRTERAALEAMAKQWTYDKLLRTIQHLPKVIIKPYAPKITKPSELRRDIGKLLAFLAQEKSINNIPVIL